MFCRAPWCSGNTSLDPVWFHTEPRHKAAHIQGVPRGDTQSPHPGEQPGSTAQTLGKGKSLVSGSCPWRALESERLACLLNSQRLRPPRRPSPAGRFSLLPRLRAWGPCARQPCCLSGCGQLHPPSVTGTPALPALPAPAPSPHPPTGKSEPAAGLSSRPYVPVPGRWGRRGTGDRMETSRGASGRAPPFLAEG